MKLNLLIGLAIASAVTLGGCTKKAAPAPERTIQQAGVDGTLDTEFTGAPSEVQAAVGRIKAAYDRGQLANMVMELERLSANQSLTEPQKKLVGNLIDEMKQVVSKRAAPGGG